jgi:N-acyl-D-aspartate/D-glutamate deacylase
MLDYLIRDALVVDGTGAPAVLTDVGVRGDRVVVTERTNEPARRVIDAGGRILTPGFIDIHTHYDAQLLWDPTASPSFLHGTTTVLGGNCGFGLAPIAPGDSYVQEMMARVEGIPLAALRAGPAWNWSSFGDWLDRLEGRTAPNVGFLVGHSTMRRLVMGSAATEVAATDDQIRAMESLVHDAISHGALGFSTSRSASHVDGDGAPVPSRAAAREEFLRLAAAAGAHEGTSLQTIPDNIISMSEADAELMIEMSLVSRRPVNWNLLKVSARDPDLHIRQLAVSDRARTRGAKVIALTLPQVNRLYVSLQNGFLFDGIEGWRPVMALDHRERVAALSDPAVREHLRKGARVTARDSRAGAIGALAQLGEVEVAETRDAVHRGLVGQTIESLAEGGDLLDAMLDLAVREELATGFSVPPIDDDEESWTLRAALWQDARTVVGGSDAGAHLDTMCGGSYTTTMLGDVVRERRLLSMEAAVRSLTAEPAVLYGLLGRGRIAKGCYADLVLVDAEAVGAGPIETRHDMPGRSPRLLRASEGIDAVWVNGVLSAESGQIVADDAGRVLRSGRDTKGTALST